MYNRGCVSYLLKSICYIILQLHLLYYIYSNYSKAGKEPKEKYIEICFYLHMSCLSRGSVQAEGRNEAKPWRQTDGAVGERSWT